MVNRNSFFSTTERDVNEYNRVMEQLKYEHVKDKMFDVGRKLELLDKLDKQSEINILLDQYKLVANSYESIQQRRIGNNNVFVFIYSAIIGLYNFLSSEHVPIADAQLSYSTYMVFFLGVIVGIMWIDMTVNIIKNERDKYRLLRMFEDHLPLRVFSKLNEKYDNEKKFLAARHLDLILPIFMMLALAINFFLMLF